MEETIYQECASWFERDDDFIMIYSKLGTKLILNPIQGLVWKNIEYGNTREEIYKAVQDVLSLDTLDGILDIFSKKGIVKILKGNTMELLFKGE